jgi:branched-chain amino acid transport system substrate-binding protein
MIWSRFAKALVVGACVVLALSSCVGCAKEAQPEEKYVTFLSLSDITGPSAGLIAPLQETVGWGFEDINARGGVDGVKVKSIVIDTRYDVARAASAYKRHQAEHKLVMAFIPQTAAGKALAPLMEQNKLSSLTPADGEFQAIMGKTFLLLTPYQDAFGATIDWILSDWKAKGKDGVPTIGYLCWDSPYGREPLRGGKEYAEKKGVKLLPPEFFPAGAADHTVWLTRISNAGADYCIIGGVDPTPSLILRDANKLGLTKKIQFVDALYCGPDEPVGIKLHPEAVEGSVLCSAILRGEEARKNPLIQSMWTKYANRPITEMRALSPGGFLICKDFEKALSIALKDVGYEKLTAEDVYQAYQKITGNSREGILGDCLYSPTSRRSSDAVKFYKVVNSKVVPITDWIKAPDTVSLHTGW